MKTKFMQAFEELTEETPEVMTEDISSMMVEQEEDSSDISVMQDQVEEAQETQETLEKMEAAATPEEAVCIAKEHMLSRIGYTSTVGIESFNASNEDFKTKVEGSIELAQEGIASRVMDSIEFAFTSEDKILRETKQAVSKIITSGSKEEEIEEPGWGRYFSVGSKRDMTFQDVLEILTKYKTIVTGKELKQACQEVTSIIEDSSAQYKKNIVIVSSEQIEKMKENDIKLQELLSKIKRIVNLDSSKKVNTSFPPLTAEQAKKIASKIEEILDDKSFKEACIKMKNAYKIFLKAAQVKIIVRGYPSLASPSGRVSGKIQGSILDINKVIGTKSKVCYAAMKYIKASTK